MTFVPPRDRMASRLYDALGRWALPEGSEVRVQDGHGEATLVTLGRPYVVVADHRQFFVNVQGRQAGVALENVYCPYCRRSAVDGPARLCLWKGHVGDPATC